ncbi:carboxypeptidase-like regulatory domain-containing protein [Salibacter sp.]|uniref:carboxypeptidase-like regulatory domain-containing protein n=1 Tax=Salibacter sp. TaxID=2010995 RepID=UPI00286FCE38|nr:carboxypeptidase-like regulatory domain-containing protein [Salibacter sp.]MDR9488106.1 carboxypeptidase-like regulatory domain-containing protein [Salibacter sp.]
MVSKFLTLSVILLLSYSNLYSQSKKLKGVAIDKESQKSIPFVHFASTSNQGVGFISSEYGTYEFQLNLDKNDTIKVSVIGYKSLKIPVSKLVKTDTVYMESKRIELGEFVVSADPKTPLEIFEGALTNFNNKEYKNQGFIAGYEELLVSENKRDTSYLKANCLITDYSPKEKTGFLNGKFYERVALIDVDSFKLNTTYTRKMNHLLHTVLETKVNDLTSSYKIFEYEVTDTTLNDKGHVIYRILGSYSDGSPGLEAVVDVTNNSFLELTKSLSCVEDGILEYRVVFSEYIDDGLPTRLEMSICSDKPDFLEKKYKGTSVRVSLTIHEKVTIPVKTESWVEGSMFNGEIDLELKEKLGY